MSTDPRYAAGHPPGEVPPEPEPKEKNARIEALRDRLVAEIRAHVRAQVELWKQVPAWALEASRRGVMNAKLEMAYAKRGWPLMRPGQQTAAAAAVHCETGEIVEYARLKEKGETVAASDATVFALALDIECLDADLVLKGLRLLAREPNESMGAAGDADAWREKKRQETGLAKPKA